MISKRLIEYMYQETEEEIENLMPNIKSRLTIDGILSGNTIVEKNHGHEGKMLHQHEYEFKNK